MGEPYLSIVIVSTVLIAVFGIPLARLLYFDNIRRWLRADDIEITEDEIIVRIWNKTDKKLEVARLGFAWQTRLGEYKLIEFENKPRQMKPRESVEEVFPRNEIEEEVRECLQARKHEVAVGLEQRVDGAPDGSLPRFKTMRVNLKVAP